MSTLRVYLRANHKSVEDLGRKSLQRVQKIMIYVIQKNPGIMVMCIDVSNNEVQQFCFLLDYFYQIWLSLFIDALRSALVSLSLNLSIWSRELTNRIIKSYLSTRCEYFISVPPITLLVGREYAHTRKVLNKQVNRNSFSDHSNHKSITIIIIHYLQVSCKCRWMLPHHLIGAQSVKLRGENTVNLFFNFLLVLINLRAKTS